MVEVPMDPELKAEINIEIKVDNTGGMYNVAYFTMDLRPSSGTL